MTVPAGSWVEIEQVVLTPDQRAPGIAARECRHGHRDERQARAAVASQAAQRGLKCIVVQEVYDSHGIG